MEFSRRLSHKLERYKAFYTDPQPGRLLVTIPPHAFEAPSADSCHERWLCGAYIHHHATGWQIHPLIAQIPGVRFLEFSWDPNCPRPVDHLDQLLELSLKKYLPQMRQGRVSVMMNVDTLEEAKKAVRLVRRLPVL